MSSIIKIVTIFVVLCGLSADRHAGGSRGHNDEILNEICKEATNADACRASALNCIFKPVPGGVKDAFCQCKADTSGVDAFYAQWVQEGGRDSCTSGGAHATRVGTVKVSFYQYLRNVSTTEADAFDCCVGTAQHLFVADGGPNVTSWKENAALNAEAKEAVNDAIDQCSTSAVKACNPKAFMTCIVQNCMNSLPA